MEHQPSILLIHDGELAGLVDVFAGLGAELHERVGAPTGGDRAWSWDLVVGTPRRLIELDEGLGQAGERIAVLAGDSRTARSLVGRAGIRKVVRLPVHPAALRLLVLHALYRGPERRRTPRARIGAAVRFRSGLRRRTAILVDLSRGGCRLITTDPVPEGRRLSLAIPAAVAGGRPLSLMGVADRVVDSDARMPGVHSMVILFEGASARDLRRIDEVLAAHADEAARLLLGRDLSAGGMRVEPHPDLVLGDEMRLALHLGVRAEPIVVRARVERDDRESGYVLVFCGQDADARSELERAAPLLPVVEMPDGDGQESGLVVSEILGRAAA